MYVTSMMIEHEWSEQSGVACDVRSINGRENINECMWHLIFGAEVVDSEYKGYNKWKTRKEALDRKSEQGMIHFKWLMIGAELSGWYVIPTVLIN